MKLKSTLKLVSAGLLLAVIGGSNAWAQSCPMGCPIPPRQPATLELITLVNGDQALRDALEESIQLGQIINNDPVTNPVSTLDEYYDFIDALVTYNPRNINTGLTREEDTPGQEGLRVSMDGCNYCNWNILDLMSYSYFLVDRQITRDPRGQLQYVNQAFSDWMADLAEEWGCYLETLPSAQYVPNFVGDPEFGCDQPLPNPPCWWANQPSWNSFQNWFIRPLDPGQFPSNSRPVEGLFDPNTVVSVGDSNSMGWWPISDGPPPNEAGKLVTGYDRASEAGRMIKGKLYNDVDEFVRGDGPGETIIAGFGADLPDGLFDGGTWTHQFLDVNNYHRLHIPISGILVYMRHIKGGTRLKSDWRAPFDYDDDDALEPGYYDPRDTPDWQFGQTRYILGIQTPSHGVVIVSAMGMAQVAGICARDWVGPGVSATKGWEFANFQFGGSDVVLIFEEQANFVLTVPTEAATQAPGAGVNYQMSLQGEKYGCLGGLANCSDVTAVGSQTLPMIWPGQLSCSTCP